MIKPTVSLTGKYDSYEPKMKVYPCSQADKLAYHSFMDAKRPGF